MIDKNWIEQRTDELCDKIDAARVRVEEIVAQNKELVAALEEIADPIAAMRANLPPGASLNGANAVTLSNDADYLKGIARTVLAKVKHQ